MAGHALSIDNVPTVSPDGAPRSDFQRIDASPDSFGASVGRATNTLGQGIEKVGTEAIDFATEQARTEAKTNAAELDAWHSNQVADATEKFLTLKGRASLEGRPDFNRRIGDLTKEAVSNASNPLTAQLVQAETRGRQARAYSMGARHAASEINTYESTVAKESASSYGNESVLAAGQAKGSISDDASVQDSLFKSDQEVRNFASRSGFDGIALDQKVLTNHGVNVEAIVKHVARDESTDGLQRAIAFYKSQETKIDAGSRNRIESFLTAPLNKMVGQQRGNEAMGRPSVSQNPMTVASRMVGADETAQRETLSKFIGHVGGQVVDPATTAWCAAFANAVLRESGLQGTNSLAARSFLNIGQVVDGKPQEGDVVVLSRGDDPSKGHVGFYAGPGSTPGTIRILAGNQGNKVAYGDFPESQVIGVRRVGTADIGQTPQIDTVAWRPQGTRGEAMELALNDPYLKNHPQAQAAAFEHINKVFQVEQLAGTARAEQLDRQILDASGGHGQLPPRSLIEGDTQITEQTRNQLLRRYDSAAGDVVAFQRNYAKFTDPNGGSFNPYDTEERKAVDTIFSALGGTPAALQTVVDRTGILPKSVGVAMEGDLVSNDATRVQKSLTLATNLLAKNQNIFTKIEGKEKIENDAVAFRHYVDDLGMSGLEAAQKIIKEQSPEYQASIKAKIKAEDIDAKIKKELSPSDVGAAFDLIPWIPFTDPKVGFDPSQRSAMFGQYAEQVKERYLETGDFGLAKKQAAEQLKKTWGVTKVAGASTVMQYPPEKAPAYSNIVDAGDRIANQAIAAVKDAAGIDVERKGLRFQPIPGITAAAYKAGNPVPYQLMWTDKNGIVQMLSPGKAFVADPKVMHEAQSLQRQTDLSAASARASVAMDAAERASLLSTPDRLLSPMKRAQKAKLEATVATPEELERIAADAGTPAPLTIPIAPIVNAITSRPGGRAGPAINANR